MRITKIIGIIGAFETYLRDYKEIMGGIVIIGVI
jgi:putative Mn2+ efflux pump MntP